MKKLAKYLLVLFVSVAFFTSCTEDEEMLAEVSKVTVEKTYFNGVEFSWTVINPEGASLTFDIYINDKLIQKDVSEQKFKVSGLKANTTYSGKIIVKSGKISPEKIFIFKTTDDPIPSAFEISSSDITPTSAVIKWTPSTAQDSSKIAYYLYVNDALKKGKLTDTSQLLDSLKANKKYNIKIVALSSNGKETSSETVFKTLDFESPTDFKLTISNITTKTALASWTASTVKDSSDVSYSLYINETLVKENIKDQNHSFKNLLPTKKYKVKVIAVSGNGKERIKEEIFNALDYPSPSNFNVEASDVTSKTAKIRWTQSFVKDSTEVTYAVYVNEKLVSDNLRQLDFTLSNLISSKKHYVKIVAKSKKGKETASETSFLTLNDPRPSASILSVESTEYDPKNTKITWTPSTIDEGLSVSYKILLNGNLYIDGITDTSFIFNNLSEGITYKVKVISVGSNGTQTESNQVAFTTITYPKITDFALKATVDNKDVKIDWTNATLDGKNTSYRVEISNGNIIETDKLTHTFNNLPAGDYTVTVTAKGIYRDSIITKVKTTKFTVDIYSTHPTIFIERANLYTKNSTTSPAQLSIKFTKDIDTVDIQTIYAGNFTISNFTKNTTSIISERLTDQQYSIIKNNKTGYVLINDGGTTYKISFDIVIKSN